MKKLKLRYGTYSQNRINVQGTARQQYGRPAGAYLGTRPRARRELPARQLYKRTSLTNTTSSKSIQIGWAAGEPGELWDGWNRDEEPGTWSDASQAMSPTDRTWKPLC